MRRARQGTHDSEGSMRDMRFQREGRGAGSTLRVTGAIMGVAALAVLAACGGGETSAQASEGSTSQSIPSSMLSDGGTQQEWPAVEIPIDELGFNFGVAEAPTDPDGPQQDDILGANRGYGDIYEANDTAASATDAWSTSADSTSAVEMRWPDTFITSSTRPSSQR